MKILDRYVLWLFLKNYLISFLVLVGMYVVLDMVFNFDELVRIPQDGGAGAASVLSIISAIGDYYFYQMFTFFIRLSGIIPVVAAAFTLMRLSRFNELVAMLASGVPLLRISMPIILASVVLNGLVLVDQEWIIPNNIHKIVRDRDEAGQTVYKSFPIWSMEDDHNGRLMAGRYYSGPGSPHMKKITLVETDERFQPVSILRAERADWDAAGMRWKLTGGTRRTGLLPDQHLSPPQPVEYYKSNITPDEIALYRSHDFVTLLSTSKIDDLINRKNTYGRLELYKVKYARFTQPIMNIILLLLAIPCVLTLDPRRLKASALQCVAWVGLCMGAVFLSQQIATSPPYADPQWQRLWPAMMAWAPVLIFGPLSVYLLDRVKT